MRLTEQQEPQLVKNVNISFFGDRNSLPSDELYKETGQSTKAQREAAFDSQFSSTTYDDEDEFLSFYHWLNEFSKIVLQEWVLNE